ncbi:hypothetical protein BU15DRAFT_67287 [Melanogaster broomeanus]|nr:hypothetical protein BU15DRAFT_67287 [Melanogaster broomeanus]
MSIPSGQRARTKASDLSDIFRSAHGSRHSSKPGTVTGSSPTSAPVPADKPAVTKPRRSMLPFLGRKKPAEQYPVQPAAASARKSSVGPSPVNTLRRSFGNGHAVLMITPSTSGSCLEPPLPSSLPPLDVSPSTLGSKIAAHFTPLRSPSKAKSRHSLPQKPVVATPPTSSPTALSPPMPDLRTTSAESQRSSTQSRSTTPRPYRAPQSSAAGHGDNEEFSDLFTLPSQLKQPSKSVSPAVNTNLAYSTKRSAEVSPASITPPSSPRLQFPIPPSTIGRPSLAVTERRPMRNSGESNRKELASIPPQRSKIVVDNMSDRTAFTDLSSEDDRRRSYQRTISYSGSDTDASRAYDSGSGRAGFRHTASLPKSSMKPLAPSTKKAPSGSLANTSAPNCPQVVASQSSRLPGISPRPRANTLSITSNLIAPVKSVPVKATIMPDATADELREALVLQRKKHALLQQYVVTVTKRYEDDRTAMAKTVEKLERDIRKKTREIEGLRWLVIHNGAAGDIDAAASLARSSLSLQDDGDVPDGGQASSPSSRDAPAPNHGLRDGPSSLGQQDLGIHFPHTRQSSSSAEVLSDVVANSATSSQTSLSFLSLAASSSSPLSAIPEQLPHISRRGAPEIERRTTGYEGAPPYLACTYLDPIIWD